MCFPDEWTWHITDTFIHPHQLYTIAISSDLRKLFNRNDNNSISFWDCPSNNKWPPHLLVDKKSKYHKIKSILPSKNSWEVSKKDECNSIVKKWQMYFQASDYKRKHFLELNNDDNQPICPTYSKGGAWLKHFGFFNSLCACITRLITNHGEYRLRFFPNKPFTCLCGNFSIETRAHILHGCVQYMKSWNPKWKSLKDILTFLEFNPGAFCFQDSNT